MSIRSFWDTLFRIRIFLIPLWWDSVQPPHFHKSISCTVFFSVTFYAQYPDAFYLGQSLGHHKSSLPVLCSTVQLLLSVHQTFWPVPNTQVTQSSLNLWTWTLPQGNPEPSCWPRMHWKGALLQGGLQPQPLNPDKWGRKARHPQLKPSSLTFFSSSSSSSCEALSGECHFSVLGGWWWAPSRTHCVSPHRTDSVCPERGLSMDLHWGSEIKR